MAFSLQGMSKLLSGRSTMSVQTKLLRKSKLRIIVSLTGETNPTEALRLSPLLNKPDGIFAELFKYGAEEVAPVLRQLLLEIWKTKNIPSDWKEGLLISMPQKGDLSRCKNWRGIILLNSFVKVLAFIILKRVAAVFNTTL